MDNPGTGRRATHNRIVVMREGRVEAVGTLEELMEVNREMRRLWRTGF